MFNKDLQNAIKNIYVSKAISRLEGGSSGYLDFLYRISRRYSPDTVKAALKELYIFNKEIEDIERLTAALIIKNYNI